LLSYQLLQLAKRADACIRSASHLMGAAVSTDKPMAKLRIPGRPTLLLYTEFLVEAGGVFRMAS